MLTDDQLTTQLRDAFHDATDDLRYAGRVPRPRSPLAVAAPVAASVAVVATLAGVWATSGSDEPVRTPQAHQGQPAKPHLVTSKIQVAGFAFSGTGPADDLYAMLQPHGLPDDATPIDAPAGVKAWVGTDAASGDHGVWVEAPTRNDGGLFAVLSPTWTIQQLTDLFYGEPRPVPAVS